MQTELSFILEYELNFMKNKETQASQELIDHLQKYGNQLMYF